MLVARAKRFALPGYMGAKAVFALARSAGRALSAAHDAIRDERYLLGVRLNNLSDRIPSTTTPETMGV